jgi:hypothetical protein
MQTVIFSKNISSSFNQNSYTIYVFVKWSIMYVIVRYEKCDLFSKGDIL